MSETKEEKSMLKYLLDFHSTIGHTRPRRNKKRNSGGGRRNVEQTDGRPERRQEYPEDRSVPRKSFRRANWFRSANTAQRQLEEFNYKNDRGSGHTNRLRKLIFPRTLALGNGQYLDKPSGRKLNMTHGKAQSSIKVRPRNGLRPIRGRPPETSMGRNVTET
ncbi:hypothetical protein RUM43_010793 [Polyplax serrata]|uniref:Uncharacterized protein n=1 Tax=Polyplax serrata TaxID=468196 RepID=A0AAN8P7X9_POLSC